MLPLAAEMAKRHGWAVLAAALLILSFRKSDADLSISLVMSNFR
jgi:hypothetical protein